MQEKASLQKEIETLTSPYRVLADKKFNLNLLQQFYQDLKGSEVLPINNSLPVFEHAFNVTPCSF